MDLWLEQHREAIRASLALSLVFSAVLGGVVIKLRRSTPAPIVIRTLEPPPPALPAATITPQPILVYVLGAVTSPGVYTVPWDSRVRDVVAAGGGLRSDADPAGVNLAERVHDGQQLYVPSVGEVPPSLPTPGVSSMASDPSQPGAKVNLNTADVTALATLPGIGPTLAQRIVDYRLLNGPFSRAEDLTRVVGIGDATLSKIRSFVTVD
jgi:competence protein ComEA